VFSRARGVLVIAGLVPAIPLKRAIRASTSGGTSPGITKSGFDERAPNLSLRPKPPRQHQRSSLHRPAWPAECEHAVGADRLAAGRAGDLRLEPLAAGLVHE